MQTHEVYWNTLMQVHALRPHPGRGVSRWTGEDILACLQSWATQEGRQPTSGELIPQNLLPGYTTIAHVLGSVQEAYTQLGWPYPGYGDGRRGQRPGPRAVNRQCLACDAWFYSPDPVAVRLCAGCKGADAWEEDAGVWMNGTVVSEAWEGVVDFWEVTG